MDDKSLGLYDKFTVVDNRTGRPVEEFTFTLKPNSDPCARIALQAYADAAETQGYHALARDLDRLLLSLGA